jgi:hypothetical protein
VPAGRPGKALASSRSGYAAGVCPFCPVPFTAGTGIFGWLRPASPGAGPAVTPATSPYLGQAVGAASKEKQQSHKHATSVITGTFLSLRPCRAGRRHLQPPPQRAGRERKGQEG